MFERNEKESKKMNNNEFWNSINQYDEHKNVNGQELLCDVMVKQGLGQTSGGYFEAADYPKYKRKIDRNEAEPSQAFHFFEYYIDDEKNNRSKKQPTYASLKCPQLIMYVAEMAGLNGEILKDCLDYIEKVEKNACIVGSKKGGGYLEKLKCDNGDNCLAVFKDKIHIREIQSIIIEESSLDEIIQRVSQIAK